MAMAHPLAAEDQLVPGEEGANQMATEHPSRVWRACLECRKKKSKCDGKDTCGPCELKKRECIYPASNDNASSSRQLRVSMEAQCRYMESLCQRMETFMERFNSMSELWATAAHQVSQVSQPPEMLHHSSNNIQDTRSVQQLDDNARPNAPHSGESPTINRVSTPAHGAPDNDGANKYADSDDDDTWQKAIGKRSADYVMTTDSYGKLRFVGGTSTMMMIDAMKSLSPSFNGQEPSPQAPSDSDHQSPSILELPFFNRGTTWPRLPYLPRPEQLVRPPKYIADLLIDLYFSKLHYTMPILYKPHFMQRYNLLIETGKHSGMELDAGFLAVLFAVWACASALLPRDPTTFNTFTGIQYYENAITLYYASTGEGTIEQVQTLALLSMCSAGWNTLAQSWKLAGQAVRAAQDLGLHRSPARGAGENLKEELCRRVWWSIYDLDRVLSVCLGRPTAAEDDDCDAEMPLDLDDSELEAYGRGERAATDTTSTGRLSGFIACSYLCKISCKIARSVSSLNLNRLCQGTTSGRAQRLKHIVEGLDQELVEWLQQVPDSLKFSPNKSDAENPHLTMCVISYIVHAGCVLNLYWPLISYHPDGSRPPVDDPSYQKCINAARSCVHVAELVQECVLPSHYLAFCAHYLALSGVFLLRNAPAPMSLALSTEIESCIRYLKALEKVWTGARRSRLVLEELYYHTKPAPRMNNKRTYSQMAASHNAHSYTANPREVSHGGGSASHNYISISEDDMGFGVLGDFDVIASMEPLPGQDFFADFF